MILLRALPSLVDFLEKQRRVNKLLHGALQEHQAVLELLHKRLELLEGQVKPPSSQDTARSGDGQSGGGTS